MWWETVEGASPRCSLNSPTQHRSSSNSARHRMPGSHISNIRITIRSRFGLERALNMPARFSTSSFLYFDMCRNIGRRSTPVKGERSYPHPPEPSDEPRRRPLLVDETCRVDPTDEQSIEFKLMRVFVYPQKGSTLCPWTSSGVTSTRSTNTHLWCRREAQSSNNVHEGELR